MPIISTEGPIEKFAPQAPAQPDAQGYASLMGKAPAELSDLTTREDAPHDGQTRIFKREDGGEDFVCNGQIVFTMAPPKVQAKLDAQSAISQEVSAWQKRRAALRAKVQATETVEVGGEEWYVASPSFKVMPMLMALRETVETDDLGTPINAENWLIPVCKVMFQLMLVQSVNDSTPFFANEDEAEQFLNEDGCGLIALELFRHISDKLGFLMA